MAAAETCRYKVHYRYNADQSRSKPATSFTQDGTFSFTESVAPPDEAPLKKWLLAIGAFGESATKVKSRMHDIKRAVRGFYRYCSTVTVVTVQHTSYVDLKNCTATLPSWVEHDEERDEEIHLAQPLDHLGRQMPLDAHHSFKVYESVAGGHLHIRDRTGRTLAYLARVDTKLTDTLDESARQLLTGGQVHGERGSFVQHHFAVWSYYAKRIFQSAEYRDHRESVDAFIDINTQLIRALNNILHIVAPHCLAAYNKNSERLKDECGHDKLFGAWTSIAVNVNQTSEHKHKAHRDHRDLKSGYAAVVPFGTTYQGGELILWQLGVVIRLRPGDVLLFSSANLIHSSTPVTAGLRHSLVAFSSADNWRNLPSAVRRREQDLRWAAGELDARPRRKHWLSRAARPRQQAS